MNTARKLLGALPVIAANIDPAGDRRASEPNFDEPCAERRGRVEERDGLFLHFCCECGAWGAFGYDVSIRAGRLGRWYCAAHRPLPKANSEQ
jgi:hypothetical protein